MQIDDVTPVGHYFNARYLSEQRLASFRFLLLHVLDRKHVSVAEIGKGSGMLAAMLRAAGVNVTTIDNSGALSPDILMDVRDIGSLGKSFDCVVCAQVLEHLPFSDLRRTVSAIVQTARSEVVITIPDRRYYLQMGFKIPGLGDMRFRFDLPIAGRSWHRQPNPEHQWEMNRPPFKETEVLSEIAAGAQERGFSVYDHGRIPGFPLHHYFLLRGRV